MNEKKKQKTEEEEEQKRRLRALSQVYLADETFEKCGATVERCGATVEKCGATENKLITRIIWQVIGVSGGIYDVVAVGGGQGGEGVDWSCNCPDFQRRKKLCKHIFFIQQRRLREKTGSWEAIVAKLYEPCEGEDFALLAPPALRALAQKQQKQENKGK